MIHVGRAEASRGGVIGHSGSRDSPILFAPRVLHRYATFGEKAPWLTATNQGSDGVSREMASAEPRECHGILATPPGGR